jgi:hypothetical protein
LPDVHLARGASHADVKAISSRFSPGTLAPQFKSTYSPASIAAFAFDWSAK